MKDRRGSSGGGGGGDRFAVFPFSMGCMSQSAVAVADPSDKKPPQGQGDPSSSSSACSSATAAVTTATTAAHAHQGSSEDGAGGEAVKSAAAAGLVAAGVSRLMKGIRSLSHMFAAYDGDDEDDDEEEPEMVIGYPTDVQHVGHIGWDGRSNTAVGAGAAMASMVNAFSLPSSLSLHHLDMAMDRAAAHASA